MSIPETCAAEAPADDILERYAAAEQVLDATVKPLVLNEGVAANWIGAADFWYRRQRQDGGQYIHVSGGRAGDAFDHAAAAHALSAAAGAEVRPWALDVESIGPDGDLVLRLDGQRWRVAGGAASKLDPVRGSEPGVTLSPSGDRALFARDNDLYLRNVATGEERRLTTDGEEDFAWGQYPDSGLIAVVRRRNGGLPLPPFGWSWSPDGALLVGGRVDERHIEPYPFLESVPQDGGVRPRAHMIRQPLVGEPGSVLSVCIIDAATGRRIPVALPDDLVTAANLLEVLGWRTDGKAFYSVVAAQDPREIRLLEVDAATGAVRTLLADRPEGYANLNSETYNRPNIRLVAGGRELIWYSERTGWGHLYRYDLATGALLNPVTSGDWLVRDILHVDEERQRIFFTAGGREGGNPYYRRLYRVGFDGSGLTLLTPEDADHTLDGGPVPIMAMLYKVPEPAPPVSPDGKVFIDSWSTVEAPGITVLRSTEDGRELAVLERADASALFATGWRPPEMFTAKAADGETDLYGVLYRPNPALQTPAPVIDAIYGGPQVTVTPRNFRSARAGLGGYGRSALARLGFAVVVVDGRGTPLRSKAFQNAGYQNFADMALDDHVAVLKQLCDRDPTLDADRIGIYGHSFGGYTSARAILRHPDVYKVAVSSAGSHNLHGMYGGITTMLPPPDFGGGLRAKPDVKAVADNYRALDTATLAANLRGKLLLAYGDMDENAFPAVTLQLADALTRANRSYDLLYMPNRMHGFTPEPYYVRRLWDYFVEHLMGVRPPLNYAIGGATAAGGFG